MKINWFLVFIAACLAGICAFGFFQAHVESQYRLVITIGSFISFFVPLAGMIAIETNQAVAVNVRIVSVLALSALLADHIFFTIKIKAWQLQLLNAAFGNMIDTSKIGVMLKTVPLDVLNDVGFFSLTPYVVITGVLVLVYVLIAYAIGKALQNG
ncbi:hypothetical protein FACS189491_02240 [Spirochaetia bacterium]|nr:hypothetical protein FACS189491_02240 [Spirochaetia bacterium]